MTSFNSIPKKNLRRFFNKFYAECIAAEVRYNFPSVVILALAACASGFEVAPPGNNLFRLKPGNPLNLPVYYNCIADCVLQFTHALASLNPDVNAELPDLMDAVIDSPAGDCIADNKIKAKKFCAEALPAFFELAYLEGEKEL